MANIKIENISGFDLFNDSESYFTDLNDSELNEISGGFLPLILVVTAAAAAGGAIAGYLFGKAFS